MKITKIYVYPAQRVGGTKYFAALWSPEGWETTGEIEDAGTLADAIRIAEAEYPTATIIPCEEGSP